MSENREGYIMTEPTKPWVCQHRSCSDFMTSNCHKTEHYPKVEVVDGQTIGPLSVPTTDQEQDSKLLKRDIGFLEFMYDRLVGLYGENPSVDYLIHARRALDKLSQPTSEPTKLTPEICKASNYFKHRNKLCICYKPTSSQDLGEKL